MHPYRLTAMAKQTHKTQEKRPILALEYPQDSSFRLEYEPPTRDENGTALARWKCELYCELAHVFGQPSFMPIHGHPFSDFFPTAPLGEEAFFNLLAWWNPWPKCDWSQMEIAYSFMSPFLLETPHKDRPIFFPAHT